MKRSTPLARKTPLNPGAKPLRSHKPMARSSVVLRARKPKSEKPKRASRATGEDKLCHGQECFIQIPGICTNNPETVVPCHSNQYRDGKGKGIKALDKFTVPGCGACHFQIDQGMTFTKEEKFGFWDNAYARWGPYREQHFGVPYVPIDKDYRSLPDDSENQSHKTV